jgi:hypothetical protein
MIESPASGRARHHPESAPPGRQGASRPIATPAMESDVFSAGWVTSAIAWICLRIALVIVAFWLVG